jgi:ribosomal protein S18 acetylase RimI-like enzyme
MARAPASATIEDMQTRIRAASPRDAAGIARIHAQSWRDAYRGILPAGYLARLQNPALARHWRQRLGFTGGRDVLVAERSRRVVGFATLGDVEDDEGLEGFAGEIGMLYLQPELTGRGIGTRLFQQALSVLERYELYWAVAWVLEANTRAQRFYRCQGMRDDGARRQDLFDGIAVRVARYAKPINPAIDYARLKAGGPIIGFRD